MEKVAERLTEYLYDKNIIEETDYTLYQYGFQVGIELVLCLGCSLLIAFVTNTFICVTIFWLFFLSIRSYIGGIHMKKYLWCFVCSCLVSNGISLFNKIHVIPCRFSALLVILSSFYLLGVALMRFRQEENNRAENKYFLKKLVINLSFIILVVFLFLFISCFEYASQCAYTMLVIVISEISAKIVYRH